MGIENEPKDQIIVALKRIERTDPSFFETFFKDKILKIVFSAPGELREISEIPYEPEGLFCKVQASTPQEPFLLGEYYYRGENDFMKVILNLRTKLKEMGFEVDIELPFHLIINQVPHSSVLAA